MCLNGDTLCLMGEQLKQMNEIYKDSILTAFNGITFDFPIVNRFKIKWKGLIQIDCKSAINSLCIEKPESRKLVGYYRKLIDPDFVQSHMAEGDV